MSVFDLIIEMRNQYELENPGIEPKVVVLGVSLWGELMEEMQNPLFPMTSGDATTIMGMKIEIDGTRYYSIAIGRDYRKEITEVR